MIEINETKSCWGATIWGLAGISLFVAIVYLFGGFEAGAVAVASSV
jgi:hypothetical protein